MGAVGLLSAVVVLLLAVLLALRWERPAGEARRTATREAAAAPPPAPPQSCARLQVQADSHYRAGRFQPAVDSLMACADAEPLNATHHWNVGVLLSQLKAFEDALSWMEQAVELDGAAGSAQHLRGAGTTAMRAGQPCRAGQLWERALEVGLRLEAGEWNRTLLESAATSGPEELVWIEDEDPQAAEMMHRTLEAGLACRRDDLKLAALFAVLTSLRPDDVELRRRQSEFLVGAGWLTDGAAAAVKVSELVLAAHADPPSDAYGASQAAALAVLGLGLESWTILLARRLLVAGDSELDGFAARCGGADPRTARLALPPQSRVAVSVEAVRGLLAQCLVHQRTIPRLLEAKATSDSSNGFQFNVLHHVAAFGRAELLSALMEAKPDLGATTTLGHTALHLAALRGHVELLGPLVLAGAPKDVADTRGRTAGQLSCFQPRFTPRVAQLFGADPATLCSAVPSAERPMYGDFGGVGGGWLSPPHDKVPRGSCDFEVLDGGSLLPERFVFDVLATQRPVLVRGGLGGPVGAAVRTAWARAALEEKHGNVRLVVATIPYAEQFGLSATELSLAVLLSRMAALHADGAAAEAGHPLYAFGKPDKKLLEAARLPAFLDPIETEVALRPPQFYVGPAGSGAPFHMHRAAYNALVYGRKRWLLRPPEHAL